MWRGLLKSGDFSVEFSADPPSLPYNLSLFIFDTSDQLWNQGTSKEWEIIVIIDGKEWCTTSTIASLDRGVRKVISGGNLGSCGSATKKLNLQDFQTRESIVIKIKPIAELNDMTVTKVWVYNCNWNYAGSDDNYNIALKDNKG